MGRIIRRFLQCIDHDFFHLLVGDRRLTSWTRLIDRLMSDSQQAERPVVLYSDHDDISTVVGQTLLWADHYLVADRLAALAAAGRDDLPSYRSLIAELLDLRPLVEAGVVVPVFTDLAVALITTAIDQMIAVNLSEADYVAWAEQQVVIEGPTAREVAFVHIIDDYKHDDGFYLHSRMEPTNAGQASGQAPSFRSKPLNHYEANYDYDPWLATVRRQAVAQLTKLLDIDLAISSAFGADLFTRSPFRARALRHLGNTSSQTADYDISGLAWADVPWLPDASPEQLMRIARSEPRVEELRRATATALRTVENRDIAGSASAVTDVAADLKASASRLRHDLLRRRSLDLAVPATLATGSVLIAATITPLLTLSAILAGAGTAIPAVRSQLASRKTAAYAFWMAHPRAR